MPARTPLFTTVLIANRGEIAVRVTRTLHRLGIRAAAVYSDADVDARHVREADVAVRIGPTEAALSYLDIDAVVAAALSVGAEAIHPGYGFLSENADFARACASAGLVFIGPPSSAIEAMGDKIRAKQTVEAAGVPVVPGRHQPGLTDSDLVAAADAIGYPVLIKPSAGGGGKGMRRVEERIDLPSALTSARREARTAFGDDTLLIECFVDRPRHIEVQVLADQHGSVVHLGERECSLQRRHQKVIEEAPSVLLTEGVREAIGASAVQTARACGYVGAGTVEFIVSSARPGAFFFMEMNTRLQVEHPVTELVTGIDLVEQQLRVAAGEHLDLRQEDIRLVGHAVEARIYAEDPARGFLPTGGTVLRLREPAGEHVRVDSGISVGTVIGSAYDPMLSKVIAWGDDRTAALDRLDSALSELTVLGVTTNASYLRALLAEPEVRSGQLDTGLIERVTPALTAGGVPDDVYVAWAQACLAERDRTQVSDNPFVRLSSWRLGGPAWIPHRVTDSIGHVVGVDLRAGATSLEVRIEGSASVTSSAEVVGDDLLITTDGHAVRWACVQVAGTTWLGRDGRSWSLREAPAHVVVRPDAPVKAGPLLSPMPGTLTACHVAVGDSVEAGQPVVSVEAMKMEHVVRAATSGVVEALPVAVGDQVVLDQVLATLAATGGG